MGATRVLIFDKAPYEEQQGMNLPPGFLHVVYEVDDFEQHVAQLRDAGVRFLMEPQVIETKGIGRRKIAFFEAPGGIRTEVMQVLEDWEQSS
jgi:extradiol dioxygenase family protein